MKKIIAAFCIFLWSHLAVAQTSPNLTYGQVLTPGQWNNLFAGKQDTLGYIPLNSSSGLMTGRLVTSSVPDGVNAGLNLVPGSAPPSPVNGDLWTTSAGLYVQISGTTIGPLAAATSGSFAATSPLSVNFPAGVVTYSCATCAVTGSPLSQFASTTSAQLLGVISDETGTGSLAFATGPTLVTPILGVATATSINKLTITAPATNATLTIANGKTLTANNSLTFAGTDATVMTFPSTSDTVVTLTATQTLTNKTLSGLSNTFSNIGNGALSNSIAYTLKGNFTGSPAAPQDSAISALTQKASPAATDLILIQDQAASGQLKYAQVSSVASAGSVSSIDTKVGAFTTGNGLDTTGGNVIELTAARRTAPTYCAGFSGGVCPTSGSGATYTTPANALWVELNYCGGGGGGGGAAAGVAATVAGSDGTASTFNSVNAAPGKGASASLTSGLSSAQGGLGGTGGTGTATRRMAGMPGASNANSSSPLGGAHGGSTVLFGGGAVGNSNTTHASGTTAAPNTGGGGSGAMNQTVTNDNYAAGGGGGECVYLLINSPSATYTYTIGTGGAGGVSTDNGGNGAAGSMYSVEHYGT